MVLDEVPRAAELLITADSRYRLWINGRLAARGPARSYPWQQSVDRLDVTPYLQAGANVLAVEVYQPGYSHFAYTHRGAAGLLASLRGGERTLLVTDLTWRVRRNPSFSPLVPRVSIYGSGVEDRDLVEKTTGGRPSTTRPAGLPRASSLLSGAIRGSNCMNASRRSSSERELPLELVEVRTGNLDADCRAASRPARGLAGGHKVRRREFRRGGG